MKLEMEGLSHYLKFPSSYNICQDKLLMLKHRLKNLALVPFGKIFVAYPLKLL